MGTEMRDEEKMLRLQQVIEMCGLSRSTIYDLIARGEFPAGCRLISGGRSRAWPSSVIRQWMADRPRA